MARLLKKTAVAEEETAEVEAPKASKKSTPKKKPAPKKADKKEEVSDEFEPTLPEPVIEEDGSIDPIELIRYTHEVQTGVVLNKKEVRQAMNAIFTVIPEVAFRNGTFKLGKTGAINCSIIRGREGVTKLSGEEKKFETKDRYTLKLRVYASTADELDALEEETGFSASDELAEEEKAAAEKAKNDK